MWYTGRVLITRINMENSQNGGGGNSAIIAVLVIAVIAVVGWLAYKQGYLGGKAQPSGQPVIQVNIPGSSPAK